MYSHHSYLFCYLFSLTLIISGIPALPVTQLTQTSDVIFQGQVIANISQFTTTFLLLKVYKGVQFLVNDANYTERHVQVQSWAGATPPRHAIQQGATCIVFCDAVLEECQASPWTRDTETSLWDAMGWSEWNPWTPCSVSCGTGGTQERRRSCRNKQCFGHAVETRRCNFFSCLGAVSPLMTSEPRGQFHPARRLWHRPPERPSAWRLLPDAYVWVPSAQLFPRAGAFPESFAVLMTIRVLEQTEGARGALFSLSSRRQPDAYLSLELAGRDSLRLVHSNRGVSRSVNIPARVADGNWHWLAVSVREHSAVTAYMDCTWISTELLPHNALDTPTDADLVVGYLFQGDLEQLLVSPDPEAVSQQCSHAEAVTPTVERRPTLTTTPRTATLAPVPPVDYNNPYEIEWTPWSLCNATCNEMGVQTRQSRCVDRPTRDPGELELCIESGGEVTQSRECVGMCHKQRSCHCMNGGICHKKHHCHCPPEYMGRKCQLKRPNKTNLLHNCSCLHGSCINYKCICFKGYKGMKCDIKEDIIEHDNDNNKFCKEICMNGGSCLDGQCFCTQGFSGPTCSKPRCDTPCENGGTCLGTDRCLCKPQYTGAFCEQRLCPDDGGRSKRQLFLPKFTPLVPIACP